MSTLPIRNGNTVVLIIAMLAIIVSTLPIRNGNYSKTQHYPYLLNNRQYVSTLPIRNGNFCACFLPFFITLVGNSEYLTYKEWKPFPPVGRFYMMPSCCNVSTLPIRNGNNPIGFFVKHSCYTVSTLPIRNGNLQIENFRVVLAL